MGTFNKLTFFIKFICYGSHLHGQESGSVSRDRNLCGSRLLEADPNRLRAERQYMLQPPYNWIGTDGKPYWRRYRSAAPHVIGSSWRPTHARRMCIW